LKAIPGGAPRQTATSSEQETLRARDTLSEGGRWGGGKVTRGKILLRLLIGIPGEERQQCSQSGDKSSKAEGKDRGSNAAKAEIRVARQRERTGGGDGEGDGAGAGGRGRSRGRAMIIHQVKVFSMDEAVMISPITRRMWSWVQYAHCKG
jgi:hypothetical protein